MSSPSTDEFRRRRGRRTGAAAVAAAYSGDQRQATPPFPSVCRLVEKYTMLIERHRQNQQNGSKAPPVRGKSSPSSSSSSSTTVPLQPKVLSSSAVSDEDAAAWNHLLMDGDGGRKNKNDNVDGNGRDVDTYGCYDDDYDYDDDDDGCGRRFSSVSLGSIQPGTCARAIAATAAAITARRSRRRWRWDGEEISCRLPRAPGYRRARSFIIIILLRNDGPCVSDDDRFLFHFPFCRLFFSLSSHRLVALPLN